MPLPQIALLIISRSAYGLRIGTSHSLSQRYITLEIATHTHTRSYTGITRNLYFVDRPTSSIPATVFPCLLTVRNYITAFAVFVLSIHRIPRLEMAESSKARCIMPSCGLGAGMPLITVIPRDHILASLERRSPTLNWLGGVMPKRSTRMVYRSFCATKSRTSTASFEFGQFWLTQRSPPDPCGLALLIVHGPTEEPHSRLATALLAPSRSCRVVLAGGRRRGEAEE